MTQVTYFPWYSQKENHATNNTLLLLRRLYEFNRLKFANFLGELGDDASDIAERLGLQFKQQQRMGDGVADGFITQESIKIVIESKLNGNAFHRGQLLGFLSGFDHSRGSGGQLLMLLSPDDPDVDTTDFPVPVIRTTFQQILTAARTCLSEHDEEMIAVVDDFEQFCRHEELLPSDRFTLFVPPCGRSIEYNRKYRLYFCPEGRFVRKAAFLGIYAEKSVRLIGQIEKIVICTQIDPDRGEVASDSTVTDDEKKRIVGATRDWGSNLNNHKFYLCNEMQMPETDFRKKSKGGLLKHRYFDLREVLEVQDMPDINEISQMLRCKTW